MSESAHLLLVEDSRESALILQASLERASGGSYVLHHVTTLEDARRELRNKPIDLVLLDLNLPDSREFQTLRRLRDDAPDLPVIVLTGSDDHEVAEEALRTGADDFLSKADLRTDHLVRSVRYALERRRRAREAADLRSRLEEAHRLESLGRLAGGIAHDFNNILTGIIGTASLLHEDLPPGAEEARSDVASILDGAHRAKALIDELLAFSRDQPLELRRIDLATQETRFEGILRRVLGEDVELEVHADPGLVVEADTNRLERILVELGANAVEAMPRGGTVRCRMMESPDEGEMALLVVEDTGEGMSEEVLERAFEPFYSTRDLHDGAGLGLSAVHGAVTQMGGDVRIESDPGRGTRVTIRLPLAPEARGGEPGVEAGEEEEGRRTVLVVEDEEGVRRIIERILGRQNFRVLTAADPEEAFHLLESTDARIDIIITDVIMPGLSGTEFVERLRHDGIRTPALFISGYTGEELQKHQMRDNENFLPKPFTPAELLAKLEELVAR